MRGQDARLRCEAAATRATAGSGHSPSAALRIYDVLCPYGRTTKATAKAEAGPSHPSKMRMGFGMTDAMQLGGVEGGVDVVHGAGGSGLGGGERVGFGAAAHGDDAGADDFHQAEGREQFEQAVDFFLVAGHFKRDGVRGDIEDAGAEDVGELEDLRARLLPCPDLHEGKVAHEGGFARDVVHEENVDELIDIGDDAARLVLGGVHSDGHARDVRFFGAADGERVNIEGAAAQERDDAREDAGLVFDVNDECVHHGNNILLAQKSLERLPLWLQGLKPRMKMRGLCRSYPSTSLRVKSSDPPKSSFFRQCVSLNLGFLCHDQENSN
jgi:hypothetical protein